MKKYMKFLIVVLCLFVVSGCNDKKEISDGERFKKEYSNLEIDSNNIIKYSTIDEILDILDSGNAVIYIGTNSDDLSKAIIPVLLNASESTDLDKIYYVDSNKIDKEFSIDDGDDIIINNDNNNIPVVIFVNEGNIVNYHIGSIDDKVELDDEETIQLYNMYLEGIHEVLNDQCDSSGEEHC